MRKAIILLLALIIVGSSYASTTILEPKLNAADYFFTFGKSEKQISLLDLSKISVNDYQSLTDHKMNFFEKMFFKKFQKNLKKGIDKNGQIQNKKLETFLKEHYGSGEGKSQLTALLLCIFVGAIGIHRFYLGYTWQGILQVFFGWNILYPWVLIDLIRIITGSLQPKGSEYAKTL